MKLIDLHGKYGEGRITKISDCDFEFVSNLKLYVNDGYAKTYYKGRPWKLHQLLGFDGYDHANRDRLDNQRENMRPATRNQNNANREYPPNEIDYRGVQRDKSCKNSFKAGISVNGKMRHLGNFPTPHLAALARDLWAIDLHGEFAHTNFKVIFSSAWRQGLSSDA